MRNKKIIFGILILIFCIGLIGIAYAGFTYLRIGLTDSKQIVGDIYMHYRENNVLTLENAMPSSTYDSTKYFEFTIDGKNTYTKKDIVYDIVLNHGDDSTDENRTIRIRDELLRFRLVEVVNNAENEIFNNRSYRDFNNMRIYKEIIPKNTTNEITKTYRIYMWIAYETVIGNTDNADYTVEDWNKVFASVKVNVTGDFLEKNVLKPLYEIVTEDAIDDNNIDGNGTAINFSMESGNNNGNGKFYINETKNDRYPIYYYRGNINNNNVVFANKCWKVVRTTDTGGTKMIYNGNIKSSVELERNMYTNIVDDSNIYSFNSSTLKWSAFVDKNVSSTFEFNITSPGTYSFIYNTINAGDPFQLYVNDVSVKYLPTGTGSYDLTNITNETKIKIVKSSFQYATSQITFSINKDMDNVSCNNIGVDAMSGSSTWNYTWNYPNYSLAYVGYNYGDAYELSHDGFVSGTYGDSVEYVNNKYNILNSRYLSSYNTNYRYSCNDANCQTLKYYLYKSQNDYNYIVLKNGITSAEDAISNMLANSKDTHKSSIQSNINTWYDNNLKNDYNMYLEDTKWCNDRSYYLEDGMIVFNTYDKSYINYSSDVNLNCSNNNDIMSVANGKLINPIALINLEEMKLAGARYNKIESSNYLYTNDKAYWILSPYNYNSVFLAKEKDSIDNNFGLLGDSYYVRPAISLKNSILVKEGDGTVNNPYILESES